MALLCGIDLGSLRTASYVAWLEEDQFVLDEYVASREHPLPPSPGGWPPSFTGIDAPQGLPRPGERSRRADLLAKVPTKVLPRDRAELAGWRLYRPFVEAGVELFWSIHERELASILGLVPVPGREGVVFETYPRYVLLQLWGERPPSKRREPAAYVDFVWSRLRDAGYLCDDPVTRPDHVDAMLCALAAEACLRSDDLPAGTVGLPPVADPGERVLREGFIVAPGSPTPAPSAPTAPAA
jgi:predicted nuclease with RNAse H fold